MILHVYRVVLNLKSMVDHTKGSDMSDIPWLNVEKGMQRESGEYWDGFMIPDLLLHFSGLQEGLRE